MVFPFRQRGMRRFFSTFFLFGIFSGFTVCAGKIAFGKSLVKHVYADVVLSGNEKSIYCRNPVAFMESLAQENSLRALELSLYYQGWDSKTVFFRFNDKIPPELLAFPTETEMKEMTDTPKFRDKQLAFKWAEASIRNKNLLDAPLEFCNFANLLYSEKQSKQAAEYFKKLYSDFELDVFCDAPFAGSNNYGCGGIYALAFRRGEMGFPRDIFRSDQIIARSNHLLWRNFYAGFCVPKDRDFALYILSRSRDFWDMQALADIYGGVYDSRDADSKLADYWRLKADKARMKYIQRRVSMFKRLPQFSREWRWLWEKHKNETFRKNPSVTNDTLLKLFNEKYNIIKYGAKRKIVKFPYYAWTEDLVVSERNPDYNRRQAEAVLENLFAEGAAIEAVVATFLLENLLTGLEVDEDLVETFYEKAGGGIYFPAYKRMKNERQSRLDSLKIRKLE